MAAQSAADKEIAKAAKPKLPMTGKSGAYIECGPRELQLYASIKRESLICVLEIDTDCSDRVFTYFMRGGICRFGDDSGRVSDRRRRHAGLVRDRAATLAAQAEGGSMSGKAGRGDHEVVRVGNRPVPVLGTVGGTPEQSRQTAKNVENYFSRKPKGQAAFSPKAVSVWMPAQGGR
jgi:hypothetical protein